MSDFTNEFAPGRRPTAERPLLGQMILVVEDSRHAGETMRLMCLRGGARVRRADSLRAAERHLTVFRPSVAIVDAGLPDGCGIGLIRRLATGANRVPAILATSGDPDLAQDALAAGAAAFLPKPYGSVGAFHAAILAHLPHDRQPAGPRLVSDESVRPDDAALRDDLTLIADLLDRERDRASVAYALNFARGLALATSDAELLSAVAQSGADPAGARELPDTAAISALVRARLTGVRLAV